MIQVELKGRLSNNMFQIAAAASQAVKCNLPYRIPSWEYSSEFSTLFPQGELIPIGKMYQEPFFHFNPIPCVGPLLLQGYFQSDKYFNEELTRNLFRPAKHVEEFITSNKKEVTGIHIRRGDYLKFPDHHTNLSLEYYKKAMELFPGPYMIFSDDIPWCKENIQVEYYSEASPVEDLFLLASCPRIIMANSSFSWWASYLGQSDTIAPKEWFGSKLKHKTDDLYLPQWKVL